jgi:pimeloyl-ACP methyl ester carboxylesterase
MAKGYLNVPWGQVHFRTAQAGTNLPALILLHQSPLSSETYEPLLPHLASWCRPFALDTPGYGESSPAPEGWEVADYVSWVWTCADLLGLDKVMLFGRATGSVFALEAAMARPARTQCLMLYGFPAYTPEERAHRMAHHAVPHTPKDDGSHLQAIWNRIKGEYPWMDPRLVMLSVRGYLAAGEDFASSYRAIWRHLVPPRPLPVPTLVLGGTKDRLWFMFERGRPLFPGAEFGVLEGATDFVMYQEPERLAAAIAAFAMRRGSPRPSPATRPDGA